MFLPITVLTNALWRSCPAVSALPPADMPPLRLALIVSTASLQSSLTLLPLTRLSRVLQRQALKWMVQRERAHCADSDPVPHPTICRFQCLKLEPGADPFLACCPPHHSSLPRSSSGLGAPGLPLWGDTATGRLLTVPPQGITDCRGGLLCDEPGMGKTITMVSRAVSRPLCVHALHASATSLELPRGCSSRQCRLIKVRASLRHASVTQCTSKCHSVYLTALHACFCLVCSWASSHARWASYRPRHPALKSRGSRSGSEASTACI